MSAMRKPVVQFKKIDEFKTGKYRVEIEFYGIDSKNSLKDVIKYSEWNLANSGGMVTKLSVKKIPDTDTVFRAYEWSIHDKAGVKEFDKDPQAFMQKAIDRELGIKDKKVRYLAAPGNRKKGKSIVLKQKVTERRGGKCYNTTGENPGEIPCPAETSGGSGGGWHC